MNIESLIKKSVSEAIQKLYQHSIEEEIVQIQKTRKDIEGDFTIVVFPLLRYSKKSPQDTAKEIGAYLKESLPLVTDYKIVNGFLNLVIDKSFWIYFIQEILNTPNYGIQPLAVSPRHIVLEYSSPNTNKPLHLGHIRNNLLGDALSRIFKANGHLVHRVNLVNDRGIHICKSMLAWMKWGEEETPETANTKGDHLVGKYYVLFDKKLKEEVNILIKEQNIKEEQAKKEAPLMQEAQKLLRKWERQNKPVIDLWKKMNSWVYAGFNETYKKLGIEFDKTYYESETYSEGKNIILSALKQGLLGIKDDDSVFIDLREYKMDEKILLRSDGTSVYMTQDIGTAVIRYNDYKFDDHVYVVGNEQDYHFKVLKIILEKFGYTWASRLSHFSYGMVELPEGKMKSREGTVVDADDLVDEMIKTAKETSEELGKLEGLSEQEINDVHRIVALGALKYFILKVDPKRNMTFNPKESIDFNGNTGPFIQYTYTRIKSVLRKAAEQNIHIEQNLNADIQLTPKEIDLVRNIYSYPSIVKEGAQNQSPALIANYVYELAKEFNQFYHDHSILKEENTAIRNFRLAISKVTGEIIKSGLDLLGIEVPERM